MTRLLPYIAAGAYVALLVVATLAYIVMLVGATHPAAQP